LDGETGAGIAAARIHEGLLARGVVSRFCVANPVVGLKNAFTPAITILGRAARRGQHALDRWMLRHAAAGYDYVLSTGAYGLDIGKIVRAERPDIVQLHWIGGNTFRLSSMANVDIPIVWRLSDQWPFCGVQHLEPDPDTYIYAPRAVSWFDRSRGVSEYVRHAKQASYAKVASLTLACPSRWLVSETKRSALLGQRPIELIPTSCDTDAFSIKDRNACRTALGLSPDKHIVLVGATSMATRWKGPDLFVEAIQRLSARSDDPRPLQVISFGKVAFDAGLLSRPVEVTHLGQIKDRRLMSILYGAADVFAAPSRMENLSNAVLEALACGTPVVAFAIGGMPDMIDHQVNGFLAAPFETSEFANGLRFTLQQRDRSDIRTACRQKVLNSFSREQEIERYVALYRRLLSARAVTQGSRQPSPAGASAG
jgi:glycosyltransferase involved in cell wall biosynthesis